MSQEAGKVTIKQIAERVGVSPSTVSYALNGGRKISDAVKARIDRVVRELNYHPSYAARIMTTKRTGVIAVVVDQCENPASGQLLTALGRALAEYSCEMLLSIAGDGEAHALALLEKFNTGMADGVINMAPQVTVEMARRHSRFVPVVTFVREPEAPVKIDFSGCAMDAMEYLWVRGHRRIGLLTTRFRHWQSEDPCLDGYRRFLAGRGTAFEPELVFDGGGSIPCGATGAARLLERGATAILAGNDQMAVGVYQWAYAHHLHIPHDLSVIGFDDCPLAAAVCPPLTTIPIPIDAMARFTVETLLAKIDGRESGREALLLHPQLIERSSVASLV